jgi:hypothetical protein
LETGLPSNTDLPNKVAINACVKEFSTAISKALADSTPKCRPRHDPRPSLPACIQEEMFLKKRLWRQWQFTSNPTLKAEVNRLQRSVTNQLNEWRYDQWSNTLESLNPEDQSLWKMTRRMMRIPTPSAPLVTPGGPAVSDSEKAEALADSLETQFQPANDPSVPTGIEVINEAMRAYSYAPAREPQLTNPADFQAAILGLKICKAPGPDGITNRALKHLPLSVVSLLDVLFNAILRTQNFPAAWKHARVFSILKPGKDPALPLSCRTISLLDTFGKLRENRALQYSLRSKGTRATAR